MVAASAVEVTVVVPAYNAASTIGVQLLALSQQDLRESWEVVVVDDASTDDTAAVAESFRDVLPQLRVHRLPHNLGTNGARNTGARIGSGRYLLFCDADDEADPHWAGALVAGLRSSAGVGGRVDLDRLNSPRIAARGRPYVFESGLVFDRALLPSAVGASCGVRREVWEELGGFDESVRWGGEDDIDFYWRLQMAGHSLAFVPDAVVGYRVRSRLISQLRRQYVWGYSRRQMIRAYGRLPRRHRPSPSENAKARRSLRPDIVLRDLAWWVGQLAGAIAPDRAWTPMPVPPRADPHA